jgi:hypothetical protein
MKTLSAIMLAVIALAGVARAEEPVPCEVPAYLLFGDTELNRVAKTVNDDKRLNIAVIGTTSSSLAGPAGAANAYPARMEASLRQRLPGVAVGVDTLIKARQTAADMAQGIDKLLSEKKPALVIWQTGTFDAMRGIDPEEFRTAIDEGVETIHRKDADVVLMNMQYSPRTESVLALTAYVDNMRLVSRDREIPLFDRLAIMRHWSESGAFDLHAATKDFTMAGRVHDCIGRALASMIIDAAHLGAVEAKAPQ